jgi:hypothetical protein
VRARRRVPRRSGLRSVAFHRRPLTTPITLATSTKRSVQMSRDRLRVRRAPLRMGSAPPRIRGGSLREVSDTRSSDSGPLGTGGSPLREVCDTRTSCSGAPRIPRGALREVCDTRTSRSGAPRIPRGALQEVCDAQTSCSGAPRLLSALRPTRWGPPRAFSDPPRPLARPRRASAGAGLLLRRRRENLRAPNRLNPHAFPGEFEQGDEKAGRDMGQKPRERPIPLRVFPSSC